MNPFTPDSDWLNWHPSPSKPSYIPPPGAVDAHCHVFGPGQQFPFAPERKYTPCDASKHQLRSLHEHLGLSKCVIVQATCHGADNRALVDALETFGSSARGVATVKADITDLELETLHSAGVRGVRFNFVKRLVDSLPFESLRRIADRVKELGWHIVIYFESQDLPELYDFFTRLPTTLVVDHMGRPDVTQPLFGAEFELFMRFMADNEQVWSKVSCPERLSVVGPSAGYRDVVPFAKRVVETFSERVLWGTDWPHPNMKSHMPDDGQLVDMIPLIAPTEALQRKLLVENPNHLYWRA